MGRTRNQKQQERDQVERYGTGRLGDCLDENEQRGLPGCLTTSPSPVLASLSNKTMPPSTPVETLRPGWRTIMWTLWTGP
uniref:Uncharacterized protein n=1 Tax=Heterorhabditis bacteriophora TaxID=37862 RepID=A0A1I7XSI4_HETBA